MGIFWRYLGPKDRPVEFHRDDERQQAYRKFGEEDEEGREEGERRWERNPQDEEPGEDS